MDSNFLDVLRRYLPLRFKRVLSRFLMRNVDSRSEFITSKYGHTFTTISERVFLQVIYDGEYERNLCGIARQLIFNSDIVVDVGANFGWYSVLMGEAVGSEGHVHSYEPNKIIYDVLEKNITLNAFNARVSLNNCGVGATNTSAVLLAESEESAIGYFDSQCEADESRGEEMVIQCLDEDLKSAISNIAFIKIDVEGFEPYVLEGAREILGSENPPIILMEFNIEALERSKVDIDGFITKLYDLGVPAHFVGNKLTKLDVIKKKNTNLFFFPKRGAYAERINLIFKPH